MAGGIFVRRCKDWIVETFNLKNKEDVTVLSLEEICQKMANLEVRNSAFLRNKLPNLIVPLACTIDYLG